MKITSLIKSLSFIAGLLTGIAQASGDGFVKDQYPVTGTPDPAMAKFDKAFIGLMKRWRMPGGTVAIMQNDKLIFNHGYGWADIDKKVPTQPDALFRIASVSKAITAVTILKLVDRGQLKLDDKVFNILDDIQPIEGRKFNPKLKKITVRNLLNMSSGFIPQGKGHFDPMFGPWQRDFVTLLGKENLPASCHDIARVMMTMPLRVEPGRGFAYSNFDYCLLGLIIDKVTHQPYDYRGYEQFVKKEILSPLSITDMKIGSTLDGQSLPKEVHYYRYLGPVDISYQGVSTYLPYAPAQILHKNFSNGGWVASSKDLVKFVHDVGAGKVISKKMIDVLTERPRYYKSDSQRYFTMGFRMKFIGGKRYWVQTGSFTGTNAIVFRKANGTSIAVIFNARPPIYHMWRHFRPKLQEMFQVENKKVEELFAMFAALPQLA